MSTARSIEVTIAVVEPVLIPEKFLCCMTDVEKLRKIGTINVRVTEGDFTSTVRENAMNEFRKVFRPKKAFYFNLRSSRYHPVGNNYPNQRFITDGNELFITGMWAYNHLEPCTEMFAKVEYVDDKDHK